jgi:hypothetical protein
MQTTSVAFQNFLSLLRAVGIVIGSYLAGHAILGHTLSTDTISAVGGIIMTIVMTYWGVKTKTSTVEGLESAARSVMESAGGIAVSAGAISGQQLAEILALIVPVGAFLQSVISKSKNAQIIANTVTVSPVTNKVVDKTPAIGSSSVPDPSTKSL